MPESATLLLVDDDVFNREGLRLFLERAGFRLLEAGDEASAWALALEHQPDAAVVDISIPPDAATPSRPGHTSGLRLAQRLKQKFPALGLVLFSAYEDRGQDLLKLVQAGQRGIGYLLKGSSPTALLTAIRDTCAGRVVIAPEVKLNRRSLADELLAQLTPDEREWVERAVANRHTLTPREQDVMQRLAASHNTEGIAAALSVTPKTAENYIGHVYDKLGLNEMTRAAPHLRKVVVLAKACLIHDLRARSENSTP
jgi:DNA-binding NarL/FixJ family response regulator